jgi:molecular chaperone Hsp33
MSWSTTTPAAACAATAGSTPEEVAKVSEGFARPGAKTLLGGGVFIMTLDQGADMDRYQGVTPIEGETLALCAEQYFAQSEQTPTRVRLAVGQVDTGEGPKWRAGGILIQVIAGDEARGDTEDAWTHVQALFETTGEDELIDPTVTTPTAAVAAVQRGRRARLFEEKPMRAFCRCSDERIGVLMVVLGRRSRRHDRARRQDPRDLRVLLARLQAGPAGGG